nr:unnamed protein product [Callosobruchus analis]
MSSKFKCCRNKEALYYICATCLGVYHHSCANRLRSIIKISENKIFCSQGCEEKTIDDSSKKYLEEINTLKTEVSEKDKYIEHLQKTAKDFENDVIEIEEKFIEEQNRFKELLRCQKEQMYTMHTEIMKAEGQNKNLSEMIDTYRNHVKEMEKEIQQLKTVEAEMLTSISILEDTNDTYAKEIGMLQKETDITIVTANTSQSPQENLDQDNSSSVRKILVIGDEQARGVSRWLSTSLQKSDFLTSGIVMTSADLCDISKILFKNMTDFGQTDVIIVMFRSSHVANYHLLKNALRKLLPCSKFTNLLLLVKYKRRGDSQMHDFINEEIRSFRAVNINSAIDFDIVHDKYGGKVARSIRNYYIPKFFNTSSKLALKTLCRLSEDGSKQDEFFRTASPKQIKSS